MHRPDRWLLAGLCLLAGTAASSAQSSGLPLQHSLTNMDQGRGNHFIEHRGGQVSQQSPQQINEIVVRLKSDDASLMVDVERRLVSVLDCTAASVRRAGVSQRSRLAQQYRVVRLPPGVDAGEAAAAIDAVPGLSASPARVGFPCSTIDSPDTSSIIVPDDALFSEQYALLNDTLTTEIDSNGDINAAAAWVKTTGSEDVVIAVLDAGIAADHPDLREKLLPGFNVVGADPSDTDDQISGHGTEVAGVAAAMSNNAQGIAGVSWGSPILPVTTANFLGFTSDVWLAEGLEWAVDAGADVAILSFGLSAPSDILAAAVRDAKEAGVVVVASSGNTGTRGVLYPAAYPEVIAVGATDANDRVAVFSAFGPEIDLVAPGVDVLTTTRSILAPGVDYTLESGTSISAPFVAGVAALLLSVDPLLTPDEVRAAMLATAEDLGEPGWDERSGFGRLDAAAAVAFVQRQIDCLSDINGDGRIDSADFFAWLTAFTQGDPSADINRDGEITDSDFFAWVTGYLDAESCNGA
ncbi:MAG: S8 family serine peptidase [Planctomycetota bacterium]